MSATPASSAGIKILSKNRRAFHEYEVIDRYECGIVLSGTEVKSMKAGKFSFSDSYARLRNREGWLIGLHISAYKHGNIHNHEPVHDRKLLLHKTELKKLARMVDEKGFTLTPLSFFLKGGLIKVEIGLCRGKKLHDKRASIKERDIKRQTEKDLRKYGR